MAHRTRLATAADAVAIAAIYNEGIADRIATFEIEPRTPGYRNRPAYAGVAEHSVYVARAARGTGAGRAALEALCRAVSRIFPENVPSLALNERCGFRVVGRRLTCLAPGAGR